MKKHQTTKNANKLIKVENWIKHYSQNNTHNEIEAIQLENRKWLCEIEIPYVDIKVKAVSKTEANAMLRAADKAYIIIQEFLRNNMNKNLTLEKIHNMEMRINEKGEVMSIGTSRKYNEKENNRIFYLERKTIEEIEKTIEKIKKGLNPSNILILEIVDKSRFEDTMSEKEIKNTFARMVMSRNRNIYSSVVTIKDNHVIFIGYALNEKGGN